MASSNVPSLERVRSRIGPVVEPVWAPLRDAISFVMSSFFRFLIFLGIVFLIVGTTAVDGVIAGHFGIYGATAILIGVVGRLIIHLKLKDS